MARPTTFPLDALLFDPEAGNAGDAIDKGATVIGNDVWIGLGATILSGVLVGDGAVVGAGAVVSKSVPSYAVVAGNPAAIVRYRFSSQIRRRLLALAWWNWQDEELRALRDWFVGDVESFLDQAERIHGTVGESDSVRRLREMPPERLTPHRGNGGQGGVEDDRIDSSAAMRRIDELEAQVAAMRGTRAWRFAMRYWKLSARLRGVRGTAGGRG
jgi:hypothetical protein